MGLINFIDVKKSYNNQDVLRGVTFTVERGERVALIGPNGAGKTTLLRIAQGIEPADSGVASIARGVTAGVLTQDLSQLAEDETAVSWREVAAIEEKRRALEREMAAQGADLPALYKAYEKLTARFEALDGYNVDSKLKKTLLGLGLRESALTTPLEKLSSGEKMRAALARILLREPGLLVLDEPTNHLDIRALGWLEEFLCRFEGGVLLVSHDRYFLDRVSTRVIELAGGTILEHKGNYSSFAAQKQIRKEHAASQSVRITHEIARKKELIQSMRHMRKFSSMHMYEKQLDRLTEENRDLKRGNTAAHLLSGRAAHIQLARDVHVSNEIARAENAGKRFGDRVLFSGARFLIRGGEKVGIIGDNGCGKTTLLKMLLGIDTDFTGVCRIGGWVKYVFLDQNAAFPDEDRTLIEEVLSAKEMTEAAARDALSRVGLYGEEADKRIAVLSGGERVRLKLCLAMLGEPHCLVLDEPTNHLDLPAREAMEAAIAGFSGSVIAVSHDRYFLDACVSRLLVFEEGKIRAFEGGWTAYAAAKEAAAMNETRRAAARKTVKPAAPLKGEPVDATSERLRAVESEIAALEERKAALEALFGPDAERGLYEEYALADARLEKLYAEWDALI